MNLEIKINQEIRVHTSYANPIFTGKFQGFTSLNQLPHLVIIQTSIEVDQVRLIPVTQIVCISYNVTGIDRI